MTLFLSALTLVVFLLAAAFVVSVRALLALSDKVSKLEEFVVGNYSEDEEKKPSKNNIEDDIASGLVKGLQQIRSDDEKHLKLIEMARRLQRRPTPVMNQNSAADDRFDTGGDLIPTNLTKEELEVLRMFYEK